MMTHPWGHGAESVRGPTRRGEVFDCGHKAKSVDDGPLRYGDDWVCLNCALDRCPVCSIRAGKQLSINWKEPT